MIFTNSISKYQTHCHRWMDGWMGWRSSIRSIFSYARINGTLYDACMPCLSPFCSKVFFGLNEMMGIINQACVDVTIGCESSKTENET